MMISTKGRYALQIMAYLAENEAGTLIPLREITEKQNISQKYAESIMTLLSKGRMVESASGKHGGYMLVKSPSEYSIGEILALTEGELNLVSCQAMNDSTCDRSDACYTLPFWKGLNDVIKDYLNSHTLADLVTKKER